MKKDWATILHDAHAAGILEPSDLPADGLGVVIRADDGADIRRIGKLFAQPVNVVHASRLTAIREALELRDYDAAMRLTEL